MMHDKDKLLLKIANAIVANIGNIKSMKNIYLFMTISCLLCCCNNVVAQKDANAAREKAVALNKIKASIII